MLIRSEFEGYKAGIRLYPGKSDAPPAPDYSAAAKETAQGNKEAAQFAVNANRINQYTPYGSLTYSRKQPVFDQDGYDAAMAKYNQAAKQPSAPRWTTVYGEDGYGSNQMVGGSGDAAERFANNQVGASPQVSTMQAPRREDFMQDDGGGWEQRMELTPQAQATLDKQMALSDKYADVAGIGFDKARSIFENPNIDTSGMPEFSGVDLSSLARAPVNAGMTAQEAILSRLNPTLAGDEEALRTRLANQGISLGSTAYGREMGLQGQRGNDLRLQAAAQGISLDQAARQQGLNEQLAIAGLNSGQRAQMLQEKYSQQSRPLDLISALRSGSQVQNPTFQPYAQQANVAGPDLLGATNQQYTQQVAAANAENAATGGLMSGLGSLALTGAKMGMFSDRRMKENITKIGVLDNGLNLYKFDYKPEFKDIAGHNTYIGVMADEAKAIPDAVIRQSNGYDMVDYSKVYA